MERATFGAPIPASCGADCFYCMRRRAPACSSIINPPRQRQCELFVSRNVSARQPSETASQPATAAGGRELQTESGKPSLGAPDGVIGVDRWPIYRRAYRINRPALSNTTNSIRTQQQQHEQRRIITQGSNLH